MKTAREINEVFDKIDVNPDNTNFFGMTYEQGIEIALSWVLGDTPDNEFEYTKLKD